MNQHAHYYIAIVLFVIMAFTFTGMLAGIIGCVVSTQVWQGVLSGLGAAGGGIIFLITFIIFNTIYGGKQ